MAPTVRKAGSSSQSSRAVNRATMMAPIRADGNRYATGKRRARTR